MLVLGDIAAIIALVGGGAFAVWGAIMLTVLLLGERSRQASDNIQRSPWGTFFTGLVAFVIFGSLSFGLLAVPNPLARLVGVIAVGAVLMISTLGLAGLARVLADRIRGEAADQSGYWALSRAAFIIPAVCILPFIGWILFAPLALIFGFGAGVMSLRSRRVSAPPVQASEAV